MPWTTPETFTAGQTLTAASMNAIQGNLTYAKGTPFAQYRYSSGNVTLTGTTSWSTLTTLGTGADLTIAGATGDVIEAGAFFLVNGAAVIMGFDPVTVVSGAVVNSFGTGGAAPAAFSNWSSSGWYLASGSDQRVTGSVPYKLVAGDVSGGNVTVRLRYAMAAATNRIIYATADCSFHWWIRNMGQAVT